MRGEREYLSIPIYYNNNIFLLNPTTCIYRYSVSSVTITLGDSQIIHTASIFILFMIHNYYLNCILYDIVYVKPNKKLKINHITIK